MSVTLVKITNAQAASARTWIIEAFGLDDDALGDYTPQRLHRLIQRHYCDGWEGFLSDLGSDTWH